MVHSGSGNRGASADRNRLLRNDFTNSQHMPFGTMDTACHFLIIAIADSWMFTTKKIQMLVISN
jgi:hypothetical protein